MKYSPLNFLLSIALLIALGRTLPEHLYVHRYRLLSYIVISYSVGFFWGKIHTENKNKYKKDTDIYPD